MLYAIPEEPGHAVFVHPLVDGYRQQMQLAAVGLVKSGASDSCGINGTPSDRR